MSDYSSLIQAINEQYDGAGVMIAFKVPSHIAPQLMVPGGEEEKELHMTLAFLGNLGGEVTKERLSRLQIVIKNMALRRQEKGGALRGSISGLGRFSGSSFSGGKDVFFAGVDLPELPAFRAELVKNLERAGIHVKKDHGYTPHITLAYIDASDPLPIRRIPIQPISFDKIWLHVAGSKKYFDLMNATLSPMGLSYYV